MSDDSITCRVRSWANLIVPAQPPPRVTIDDVTYEFPPGTTREEAQSVLDEATRIVAAELATVTPPDKPR